VKPKQVFGQNRNECSFRAEIHTFAIALTAASLYGVSGELSDNLANLFANQADNTSAKPTL
jgi:hypothetical protein